MKRRSLNLKVHKAKRISDEMNSNGNLLLVIISYVIAKIFDSSDLFSCSSIMKNNK